MTNAVSAVDILNSEFSHMSVFDLIDPKNDSKVAPIFILWGAM